MVPPPSAKVPRVSAYSGSRLFQPGFRVRASHPLRCAFPYASPILIDNLLRSLPRGARTAVWALPISLAATLGIDVSFSSSGYLDVSVHRVPLHALWIGAWMTEVCSAGFPHSDICGSKVICTSPQLFAAYYVFHRLSVPRHPPYALVRWPSASLPARQFRQAPSVAPFVAFPDSSFL